MFSLLLIRKPLQWAQICTSVTPSICPQCLLTFCCSSRMRVWLVRSVWLVILCIVASDCVENLTYAVELGSLNSEFTNTDKKNHKHEAYKMHKHEAYKVAIDKMKQSYSRNSALQTFCQIFRDNEPIGYKPAKPTHQTFSFSNVTQSNLNSNLILLTEVL